MNDDLSFRRMITPVFIQAIFWVAAAVIVIAGIVQMANEAVIAGLLTIIIGPFLARIYAEILIVIFRINDNLADPRAAKLGEQLGEHRMEQAALA